MIYAFGGIAQLGERLTGSQEVSGSIPLISTKNKALRYEVLYFYLYNGIYLTSNAYPTTQRGGKIITGRMW